MMNVNVKLEGKEITKSLIDLFSPVTELAGAIGDQVRIYRSLSTLKTLQRAKEIAEENNITLTAPPLKFLVPFIETSSLECEAEVSMREMWAKLLVASSSEFKSEHSRFIRILNELSPKEAKLLNYICNNSNNIEGVFYDDVEGDWANSSIYITLKKLLDETNEKDMAAIDYEKFYADLKNELEPPGSVINFLWVVKGSQNHYPYDELFSSPRTTFDDLADYVPISLLLSLGLIGKFISPEYWFDDVGIEVQAYYITPLGGSFYKTCVE